MVMGIFKNQEGVKLHWRHGVLPFVLAPLWFTHASLLESRRHWRDLSALPRGCFNAQRLKGAARDSRALLLPPLSQTGGTFASPANLPLLQSSQLPLEKGMDLTGLTFSI